MLKIDDDDDDDDDDIVDDDDGDDDDDDELFGWRSQGFVEETSLGRLVSVLGFEELQTRENRTQFFWVHVIFAEPLRYYVQRKALELIVENFAAQNKA